eukprot:2773979-Pyramimonas_sp.AAC.1
MGKRAAAQPRAARAPRRGGGARGSAAASDSAWCQRCEVPVDVATSKRGGTSTAPWLACDCCWLTHERHFSGDAAWPDI